MHHLLNKVQKSYFTTATIAMNNKAHIFIFWHQCPFNLDLGHLGQIALAFYQHVNLHKQMALCQHGMVQRELYDF